MGRPRKLVQVNGKQVTGVSRTPDGRCYIIIDGKRRYFKTLQQAMADYAASQLEDLSEADRARLAARASIRHAAALDRLRADGPQGDRRADDVLMEDVAQQILLRGDEAGLQFLAAQNEFADALEVPDVDIVDTSATAATSGASRPRLRTVIEQWTIRKTEELGEKTKHVRETERRFEQFIAVVTDVPVSELTPEHFRTFHIWALRQSRQRQGNKWYMELVKSVKSVVTYCKRKYPEWPWPQGVTEWAGSYTSKRVTAQSGNRAPMPVEVFHTLLDTARAWSATEPNRLAKNSQKDKAARLHAKRKKRQGAQLAVMLQLGANCGLDNVDCERLCWAHVRFDAPVAHLDFPRRKVEKTAGRPVDRRIPLLPSVVRALQTWREIEPSSGLVFRSALGLAFRSDRLSDAVHKLREAAGVENRWSFKHLRNIGPTLAKRAKLSREERDAFLGLTVEGTSRFYEGDVDEHYLVPLVNLIGQAYFDGDVINVVGQ